MDILGLTSIDIPSPKFNFFGGSSFIIILSIFLIIICGTFFIWYFYDRRLYKYKIVVFENISGQGYQVSYKDRARLISLGDGGEELLWVKKKKKYRSAYGRKQGKNEYWFAVGQDGYWYNFVLGDLDAKLGMLDIEPIDRDMRYMHVAIRKNIEGRYTKKKMEKMVMITIVGFVITMLIMVIGNWFMLDKIAEINQQSAGTIEASNKISATTNQILGALDNVCSNSGIKKLESAPIVSSGG